MKYVIIGGVGGGATVCARLRRIDEQAELVLLERGPYISYANCGLPYYISGEIRERSRLFLQTPNGFGDRFNTDVRVRHSVEQIDRENKTVTVRDLFKDKVYMESYDKLVLSPGALPVRPPIEGVELEGVMYLRDVGDADAIVNKIKSLLTDLHPRAPHVVVVGAGFIGLEMVESLHRLGCALTVVEAAKQVMTPLDYDLARQIQKHVQERKIVLKLQERITGMMRTEPSEAHPSGALSVQLSGGASLPADRVLLSVGVKPDTALARTAGLRIGEAGGIWVNEYMQTSDPDIYAVGDAVEFPHPLTGKPSLALLAGPANRQARICADNVVYGQIKSYKGSIRTAIAKVFDLQVGCAGLSEKVLQDEGIPFRSALVHAASHAGYYPDARNLSVKIHFSPENGRLLGAQVVGEDGADKRLDVLSEAIRHGETVYDLTQLEHAYAPPFSSAKDPITLVACVAENILTQKMYAIDWRELQNRPADSYQLLDVRTLAEYKEGALPNAIHIPVDELRERLDELPEAKTIVLYCGVGLRGHVASRILLQNGYKEVFNLAGGFKTAHDLLEG